MRVEASPEQVQALGLDLWTHRATRPDVLVRVTPTRRASLDASGLPYVVVEPDLGDRVDAERARIQAAPALRQGGLDPVFYDEYRPLPMLLERLAAVAAARPERVELIEVGLSLEGRPIQGVRITNAGAPADRPVVFVQGGQHAREWAAVASTMFTAERFATAASGSDLDAWLDEVELVVVPVVNPDGYVYSWESNRYWRKNRRDGVGVDLNRNWGVEWGGLGASADPSAENYRGTGPFSEPESTAVRDFVSSEPDVVAMFDVHTYGQLVLFPWGHDLVASEDDELFRELATAIATPMTDLYGEIYTPLQSSELYPAAGNAADWAYGDRGIHALSLELRPMFDGAGGFELDPDAIIPTGEELVAGVSALIERSVDLGPGEPGDTDASGSSTGSDPTGGSDGGTTEGLSGGTTEGLSGGTTGGVTTTGSAASTDGGEPPSSATGEPPLPGGTAGTGGSGSEGGAPSMDEGGGEGCGCRTTGPSGGLAWWWWLPMLGWRRRAARVAGV